ncbi:glycosyl transferase family 90 [Aliiruegeria haliotis]|uniref:Glycosyl transferase family 90 n=1 Tax=Aliiruegeria haliotis TaxID=1280846 RepID=A0A2T0RLS6_9RHOB|nr:glycosyl transferase family 90 [Aliiruegeria haliotis]PRY22146.1 glycosyl transferase family 90 [Aliiruegeria haliotis]
MTPSGTAIYRHIPKCASSTLGQVLYYLEQGEFAPRDIHEQKEGLIKGDTPEGSAQIQDALKRQSVFVFTCVRNPYPRILSSFFDKICSIQRWGRRYRQQQLSPMLEAYRIDVGSPENGFDFDQIASFRKYLRFVRDNVLYHDPMPPDFHWDRMAGLASNVSRAGGRYDTVIKVEALGEGVEKVLTRVKARHPLQKDEVPRFNESGDRGPKRAHPVSDYYGPEEIDIMKAVFEKDFAIFGYEAESPGGGLGSSELDIDEVNRALAATRADNRKPTRTIPAGSLTSSSGSTDAERVERAVRFRFGASHDAKKLVMPAEVATTEATLKENVFAFDLADMKVLPLNHGQRRINVRRDRFVRGRDGKGAAWRAAQTANAARAAGVTVPLLANLSDGAVFDPKRLGPSWRDTPVVQHSRRVGSDGLSVLVPLPGYMEPRGEHLPIPGFDPVSFLEKFPKAIWRGNPSGLITTENGGRRFLPWVLNVANNSILSGGKADLTTVSKFRRFRFLSGCADKPRVDAKFIAPESRDGFFESIAPEFQSFFGTPMPREAQLQYRYIIALEGNDFPTSLYWSLGSNSVVFCTPRKWECILDEALTAWEHYVPIAEDGSDVEARIDWCESNPRECLAIIGRANAAMREMTDIALRDAIDAAVWEVYQSRLSGVSA